jgi:hypothetical protein
MVDTFETFTSEAIFGLDIAFVIDSTGSMMSYISGAKNSIIEIMNESQSRFKMYKAEESMLRFGIVAYRDHPPQDTSFVTLIQDFSNFTTASLFLDKLSASGGGDPPEAVLDGLNDAVNKLTWNDNTEKILFLLLDNPGHGVRFGTNYDCPCNLHERDILTEMRNKQVAFHIIRPKSDNEKLDKMIECFKEYINIEITELEKGRKLSHPSSKFTIDKALDSTDIEMRIFNRIKFRNNYNTLEKKKYNSRNESPGPEKMIIDKEKDTRRRSRSRSRSRSLRRKLTETSPKNKDGFSTFDLNGKYYKPTENSSKMIVDEREAREYLENGISDIITKTVILKLDQQLKSLNNK